MFAFIFETLTARILNSLDNNRPNATCHCLSHYTREQASAGAAVLRQRFVYGTHVKRIRELHGHRQLIGSRTLQKSGCRQTDQTECQCETDDDCPAPATTGRAPRGGSSEHRAAVQPVVNIAAEPLYLPAGSSRRQSKPSTPPRDHSAPLRFADAAASLRVIYVRSPSVATHFR